MSHTFASSRAPQQLIFGSTEVANSALVPCPWPYMSTSSSPHYLGNLQELLWLKNSPAKERSVSSSAKLFSWRDLPSACTSASSKTQRGTEEHGQEHMGPPGLRTGPQQPRFNLTSAAVLKWHWKNCRTITGLYKNTKGRKLGPKIH